MGANLSNLEKAGVVSGAAAVGAGIGLVTGQVWLTAGIFAASAALRVFQQPDMQQIPDLKLDIKPTRFSRHIYGERLVSPEIFWAGTFLDKANDKYYLDLLCYLSEGECNAVVGIKYKGTVYELGNAVNGVKKPNHNVQNIVDAIEVREYFHDATGPTQLIDRYYAQGLRPDDKDATRSFCWLSLIINDVDSKHDFWVDADLSSLGLVVQGDKCYDLSNLGNARRWTPNRVSCLYTMLRDMTGMDATDFDAYYWKYAYNNAAAKIANDFAFYDATTNAKITAGEPTSSRYPTLSLRYGASAEVSYNEDYDDVVFRLLEGMHGGMYWYGGKLRLVLGENKVFDSNTPELSTKGLQPGSFRVASNDGLYDAFNSIEYGVLSQAANYERVVRQFTDTSQVTRDGRTNSQEIDVLPYITDEFQGQRYIRNKLAETRSHVLWSGVWVGLDETLREKLLPGEAVYLTHEGFAYDKQKAIITEVWDRGLETGVRMRSVVAYSDDYDLPDLSPVSASDKVPEQPHNIEFSTRFAANPYIDLVSVDMTCDVDDDTSHVVLEWADKPDTGDPEWKRVFQIPVRRDRAIVNINALVYDATYLARLKSLSYNGLESDYTANIEVSPIATDKNPPAAPKNLSTEGVSGGFRLTTEEIIRTGTATTGQVKIHDYLHTEITIQETGQTDKVVTFTGNTFEYLDYVEATSLTLEVKFVDVLNNKSVATQQTVTTLAVETGGGSAFNRLFTYDNIITNTDDPDANGEVKFWDKSGDTSPYSGYNAFSDLEGIRKITISAPSNYTDDQIDAFIEDLHSRMSIETMITIYDSADFWLTYPISAMNIRTYNTKKALEFTIGAYTAKKGSGTIQGSTVSIGVNEHGIDGISYKEITIYRKATIGTTIAKPTGGSYVWSSDTLTAPTNWSRDFPDYNPVTEEVSCSIATGNSDDGLSSWSEVRICAAEGDLDIIFQRNNTKPSPPADSVTKIPSGWSATEPSGTATLWRCVQHRAAQSETWTRSAVFRVEGQPGPAGLPSYGVSYSYDSIITNTTDPDANGEIKFFYKSGDTHPFSGYNTVADLEGIRRIRMSAPDTYTNTQINDFVDDLNGRIEDNTTITVWKSADLWLTYTITNHQVVTLTGGTKCLEIFTETSGDSSFLRGDGTGTVSASIIIGLNFHGVDGVSYREKTLYKTKTLNAAVGSAPSGMTYTWGSDTFASLPTGWTTTFPTYVPTTHEVICSIATVNSNMDGTTVTGWSVPVVCAAEGDLDIIFQRNNTKPSPPADSVTKIPSGWSATEPSGTDLLWYVVQHRAAQSTTWTRGDVLKAEGQDGQDGAPGLTSWSIEREYDDVITDTAGVGSEGKWKVTVTASATADGLNTIEDLPTGKYIFVNIEDKDGADAYIDGFDQLQVGTPLVLQFATSWVTFTVTDAVTKTGTGDTAYVRIPVNFYASG